MNATDPQPIKIFIAYSRKDKSHLTRLRVHLAPLIDTENLTVWDDGEMMPGTKWKAEIKKHLDEADIILLLISADALSSKPFKNEMTSAFKRHARGNVVLIPIILRTCHWEIIPLLNELQALPENGNPVTKWEYKEDAYADITKGIGDSINRVKKVNNIAWDDLVETKEKVLVSKDEDEEKVTVNDEFFPDPTDISILKEDEKVKLPSNQLNDKVFIFFLMMIVGLTLSIFISKYVNPDISDNISLETSKSQVLHEWDVLNANELYIKGKYDDAIGIYEKIRHLDSIKIDKWIEDCKRKKSNKLKLDSMYLLFVREANDLFNEKKYNLSIIKYKRALELKEEGKEAKKGIDNCMKAEAKLREVVDKIMSNMVYVEVVNNDKKYGDNNYDKREINSFYISRYEVTEDIWEVIMGNNPSNKDNSCGQCPVNQVSWNEIRKFISKLNFITSGTFRLPSEMEWEFAARGGQGSKGYKYAGSNDPNDVAWNTYNSNNKTHFVGSKFPNELDLYDMSGNVWEWCNTEYEGQCSMKLDEVPCMVLRGGSCNNLDRNCRVDAQYGYLPSRSNFNIGFRLAQTP